MSFYELLSQSAQLRIPLFQREYVWSDRQLTRMIGELDIVVDGEDSNRFLGAVISVRRESNPATPQVYELVDGQQRLTTLYLLILCSAFIFSKYKDDDYATGLINTNLIIPWWQSSANTKLIPSYADRAQFNAIYAQLFKCGAFSDWLGSKTVLSEPTGSDTGKLLNQFNRLKNLLDKRYREFGTEHVKKLIEAATTKLTFVFILLKDPSNATTVFQGLNDPGIPIGIGDLVRNEVFSKVAEKADLANEIHRDYWLPFKNKLGINFDNYFFSYAIVYEPATKSADLFKELQKIWKNSKDPKEIIQTLENYIDEFLAITSSVFPDNYDKQVKDRLIRLAKCNAPSSTYPFLMRLLKEYSHSAISLIDTLSLLDSLESFLVRRAVCGIEPTGLLVMFRTMWQNIKSNPTKDEFLHLIKKRSTVDWPDDTKFIDAITGRSIYSSTIIKYLILEYEKSLGADFPENVPWIEHILPQKINDSWSLIFSKEEHDKLVHTWGNLLPLSAAMNQSLSQSNYLTKMGTFKNDSMFASSRKLATDYPNWSPDTIKKRSKEISEWAVKRWSK